MGHNYINEKVNINEYPQLDTKQQAINGNQIALGDLHGSALKLLYTLVRHGFIKLSEADYLKFVELYYNEDALSNQEVVTGICAIIERAQVIPAAKNANLMLIGDILADRGANDYYTLLLLKKLHDNHIPVDILISNHDAEFLRLYEENRDFDASFLNYGLTASAANLQNLINEGIVTRDEITDLVESSYKPCLKALSYTLDREKNEITIYSHGLIDLDNIKNIAEQLDTPFYGREPVQLAKTIDEINIAFDKHVKANKVSDLIKAHERSPDEINNGMDPKKYPLAHLIWNRKANQLNRNVDNVFFVHGHDSKNPTAGKVYNLDNTLSKLPVRAYGDCNHPSHNVYNPHQRPLYYNALFSPNVNLEQRKHPVKIDKIEKVIPPEIKQEEPPCDDLIQTILFWSPMKQEEPSCDLMQSETQEEPEEPSCDLTQSMLFWPPMKQEEPSCDLTQSMLWPEMPKEQTWESKAEPGKVYLNKHGIPLTGPVDITQSCMQVKNERPLTCNFDMLRKSCKDVNHEEVILKPLAKNYKMS